METRFYCDKCGRDVAFNVEICPYCGTTFDAAKCPVCNLIGKPALFINGCPSCGFMPPPQEAPGRGASRSAEQVSPRPAGKNRTSPAAIPPAKGSRGYKPPPKIPVFWYRGLIALFLIILCGLIYLLFRLY